MADTQGSSLRIIDTSRDDTLGFEIDGRLTEAELHAFAEQVNAFLKEGRPKRMLGRFRHYDGFELPALFDREYLTMKLGLLGALERYAIVGGPAWLAFAVRALDPLFAVEVRHFEPEEEEAAWAWIGSEAKAERALVA
jgi:hypothetical protein